jgi:hypothetical protein
MSFFPWISIVLPLIGFYGLTIHLLGAFGSAAPWPVEGLTSRVF